MYYPGLEGKTALLIAGHSNIGRHVTHLFAESGANVVIAARDIAKAEEIATSARRAGKGRVAVVEIEACDFGSIDRAVHQAKQMGGLDVCYHGIGWSVPGPFLQLEPALWDKFYDINFKSLMIAYRIVLPVMIEQKGGCFISMGSVIGRRPTPTGAVYGAFKCALTHLSQTLALEVAQYGVRINVVAPGPAPPSDLSTVSANSSFHGVNPKELEVRLNRMAEQIPLKRVGQPENVAHAVLYLASPVTGCYQTGQVLGVDGGWWMPK